MKRLLALPFPPKPLPEPDPRCKQYDYAGAVQLYRNHDIARRISAAHH